MNTINIKVTSVQTLNEVTAVLVNSCSLVVARTIVQKYALYWYLRDLVVIVT